MYESGGQCPPYKTKSFITGPGEAGKPNLGDAAASLGSTLDFIYLFSKGPSDERTPFMYNTIDVPFIYEWVFSKPNQVPPVWIQSNTSMHQDYWDSAEGGEDDQTHHFAEFFLFGAVFIPTNIELRIALVKSGDQERLGRVINQGDYDLGILGSDLGAWYVNNPGFLGDYIIGLLKKSAVEGHAANNRTWFP